jgi:hypothetical protein
LVPVFEETAYVTVPLPLPLSPDNIVIHAGSLLTAVQSHPAAAVTLTVSVPPEAVNCWLPGDRE